MGDLTWFGWIFVLYYVANSLLDIALIGKAWVITPAIVIVQITLYAFLIWGALMVGIVR